MALARIVRHEPILCRRRRHQHLPRLILLLLHHSPNPPYLPEFHLFSSVPTNCISLVQSCSTLAHVHQLHAFLLRNALFEDPSISATFLSRAALSSFHDLNYSQLLFEQISNPNSSHYNTMIRACSQSSSPHKAFVFYRQMRVGGVGGNAFTSSYVLKSCAKVSSLSGGKQIHCRILQDGQQSDSLLLTALMDLYASFGDGADACRVFEEMPTRDTVAWNVLISCFSRNRRTKDALGVFDLMQSPENGSEPDDVTCLLLLQACAHLGALEFGERLHKYTEDHGYGQSSNLRNALIVMYSKCGSVDKAYRVFCGTSKRNVICWSAMISGLAMNGCGRDAIDAFNEMQRVGVGPDEQTFTAVLSACSHCGLVDEGFRFLDMMRFQYGLVPNVHHYGCMVDVLGRAGLLDQAYRLIQHEIDVKPDATIWRTLLGACKIHGHVELGERVIEHLIELKATQAGDYILLLNLYSSAGNWEKVAEVRRLMKDKGIQTTPGCSTIEISGMVHEFIVDDDSHPRKVEIYKMLDEIVSQLKIAGYIADMESEMHAVDYGEKQSALSYHSEKLALAFGVLATPPGTTIRIAKNLRTCIDCHTFSKLVSSVYNRVVIIRDRNRFHHFREGQCSCNDYW